MAEITFCTYVEAYSYDGPLLAAAKSVPVPPLPGSAAEKKKPAELCREPLLGVLAGVVCELDFGADIACASCNSVNESTSWLMATTLLRK